jgi:hypothetical protein
VPLLGENSRLMNHSGELTNTLTMNLGAQQERGTPRKSF